MLQAALCQTSTPQSFYPCRLLLVFCLSNKVPLVGLNPLCLTRPEDPGPLWAFYGGDEKSFQTLNSGQSHDNSGFYELLEGSQMDLQFLSHELFSFSCPTSGFIFCILQRRNTVKAFVLQWSSFRVALWLTRVIYLFIFHQLMVWPPPPPPPRCSTSVWASAASSSSSLPSSWPSFTCTVSREWRWRTGWTLYPLGLEQLRGSLVRQQICRLLLNSQSCLFVHIRVLINTNCSIFKKIF